MAEFIVLACLVCLPIMVCYYVAMRIGGRG